MENGVREEVASVRAWYDRIAGTFTRRYEGTSGARWKQFEESLALELLGGRFERILDLGCGSGRLAASLSRIASAVVAADISTAMLAIAHDAPHSSNVRYCAADATLSPFAAQAFDAVVSLGMAEYLSDPSPFLREIHRVLRPGGVVVFSCHKRVPWLVHAWAAAEARVVGVIRGRAVTRDREWRPAYHDSAAILRLLETCGFVSADFRGYLFPVGTDVFAVASAMPLRAVAQFGMKAGVKIDRAIGRSPATRFLSPLAMFTARKP